MTGEAISLYYWPGACSLAPHLVLQEQEERFDLIYVDFSRNEQREAAYMNLNPKGRVPLLVHGNFKLTENPAILYYLARRRPDIGLWPEDVQDEARCFEMLAWIASTVHPIYSHVRRPERYIDGSELQAAVREKGQQTSLSLWSDIERILTGRRWVIGSYITVADFYLLVVWSWARKEAFVGDINSRFPNWTDHARRLAARPSVKRAFSREGLEQP